MKRILSLVLTLVMMLALLQAPVMAIAEAAKEPVHFSIMMKLYNEMPDMDSEFWQKRNELTNSVADIMFVPYSEYNTKRDLMLASNDLPDVVEGQPNEAIISNYIQQGLFWDFSEVVGDFSNYPNFKAAEEYGLFSSFAVNGGLYMIPKCGSKINPGLTIRKDLLDEAGLPIPTTVAEFTDAMRAVKALHPDIIGLVGHGPLIGDALLNFEPAFGCFDPKNLMTEDGGMLYYNLSDSYLDMIDWLRQCYAEDLLAQEFTVMEVNQGMEVFNTGRAFSYGRNVYRCADFETELKKVDEGAECMILPPMEGKPGYYSTWLTAGIGTGYLINDKLPLEKKMAILDYFEASGSDEVYDLVCYGIEGIHYNMVDGQRVMTEQGKAEINVSAQMGTMCKFDRYVKVRNAAATPEYNEKLKAWVEDFERLGTTSPFSYVVSDTYGKEWPKYSADWETALVQAIIGDISMDELRDYAEELRNIPALKTAWQEFAALAKTFGMI